MAMEEKGREDGAGEEGRTPDLMLGKHGRRKKGAIMLGALAAIRLEPMAHTHSPRHPVKPHTIPGNSHRFAFVAD